VVEDWVTEVQEASRSFLRELHVEVEVDLLLHAQLQDMVAEGLES
jgi:hypothetical protein